MAIELQWSDEMGWVPIDTDTGMYSAEADAAINAERSARGIDQRDLAMNYRPDVTTTRGATPGQPSTYSAGFGQIADPLITLANLAKAPGAIGRETGNVGSGADAFMKAIQAAAQNYESLGLEEDPLAAALTTQGLTPSYQEVPQETGTPSPTLSPIDAPQEGDTRTDGSGNEYTFLNGAWTRTGTSGGAEVVEGGSTPGYVALWNRLNNGEITGTAEMQQLIDAGGFTPEEKSDLAQRAAVALMIASPPGSDMAAVTSDLQALWQKYVFQGEFPGSATGEFNTWAEGLGWTIPSSATGQDAAGLGDLKDVTPGQDVGAYWTSVFEGTFDGSAGETWEQKIDTIATALYNNPDIWADRPGMAGLVPGNMSLQDVKQWLNDTAWGSISEAERTRLTGTYGVGSQAPGTYVVKGAPSAAGPGAAAPGAAVPGAATPGATGAADGTGGPIPVTGPGGVPTATPQASDTPKTIDEMLQMYVDPAGERSFSEIYPGFAASQAGYGMPTVQQAYQQAAAPLQTQYSLQLPNLMKNVGQDILSGTGMNYQTPQDFLKSLTSGTGNLLGRSGLFGALQNVSSALTSDPSSMMGMDPNKQMQTEMWRSLFEKPAQQISAFAQPFLMATRGAPEARKALTDAISRAGARFGYENPLGVDGQSFLPWAMGKNLLGIQGMFGPDVNNQIARDKAFENPLIPKSGATNPRSNQLFSWEDPASYRDPLSD